MSNAPETLYAFAGRVMAVEIKRYLRLSDATAGFTKDLGPADLVDDGDRRLMAAGLGVHPASPQMITADAVNAELRRRSAVPFDVEGAVTAGVYQASRPYVETLFDEAARRTSGWTEFEAKVIADNPHLLPVLQHVGGSFSKAALKKEVGSVSDNSISAPAAARLAELLDGRVDPAKIDKAAVLSRLESTLEGIVRDLVGRVLLESVVASALDAHAVPYLREDEYSSLSGAIYDFRADFVIPNEKMPVAFIEVRKSSSRHASLYAKDKMFSAINWKGQHPSLIGVMVVEGDWTEATLRTMAKIYDYVVPLSRSGELARVLRKAAEGDDSVLKWLVQFKISQSPKYGGHDTSH